jgi:hypothetical protein
MRKALQRGSTRAAMQSARRDTRGVLEGYSRGTRGVLEGCSRTQGSTRVGTRSARRARACWRAPCRTPPSATGPGRARRAMHRPAGVSPSQSPRRCGRGEPQSGCRCGSDEPNQSRCGCGRGEPMSQCRCGRRPSTACAANSSGLSACEMKWGRHRCKEGAEFYFI